MRARAERALHEAEETMRQGDEALAQAEWQVENLRAEFGAAGDPEFLAARFSAREAAEREIKAQAENLALVADGLDEAALARQMEGFEADAAEIRLAEIAARARSALTWRGKFSPSRAQKRPNGLRCRKARVPRLAIFARESARADIHEQALPRSATLKLAALLVDAGLARHRAERKDPLLARAGALFSSLLTEGRYSGLDQTFGEDGELHLSARRADGQDLELRFLSEGARDQLYLALRLAFLEDYAARAEAPPFIGDDLFASFDDRRVTAGFHALAAASATIQPILFTHHEHILSVAEAALGRAVQVLRLDPAGA